MSEIKIIVLGPSGSEKTNIVELIKACAKGIPVNSTNELTDRISDYDQNPPDGYNARVIFINEDNTKNIIFKAKGELEELDVRINFNPAMEMESEKFELHEALAALMLDNFKHKIEEVS